MQVTCQVHFFEEFAIFVELSPHNTISEYPHLSHSILRVGAAHKLNVPQCLGQASKLSHGELVSVSHHELSLQLPVVPGLMWASLLFYLRVILISCVHFICF